MVRINNGEIGKYLSQAKDFLRQLNLSPIVPFVSGAASLALLREIILTKELSDIRFSISVISVSFIFFISAALFYLLKELEKDKDQYLLSTVGKIVEDVFKHYGVSMASNAAGPTTANQMNPIMQTIVNLVRGLKVLSSKSYSKH